MPEYLAPGVYVEETSFRTKSIEGVSTSTAGFVGPCRYGPVSGTPELLTSFTDFERLYGGLDPLYYGTAAATQKTVNYLAHAVRAFFEEGGLRLYVSRIVGKNAQAAARSTGGGATLTARFPGRAGNMCVSMTTRVSQNLVVSTKDPANPASPPTKSLSPVVQEFDTVIVTTSGGSTLYDALGAGRTLTAADGHTFDVTAAADTDLIQMLTVEVAVQKPVSRPNSPVEALSPNAEKSGVFTFHSSSPRSLTQYFKADPPTRQLAISVPFQIEPPGMSGAALAEALMGASLGKIQSQSPVQFAWQLTGGADGDAPTAYDGDPTDVANKTGLAAFEDLEDISIVAAPGSTGPGTEDTRQGVQTLLIAHCEKMRYRIAVIDSPPGQALSDIEQFRNRFDSEYAALYYPWICILDPLSGSEIQLPPSGFVAGIYARNDQENGVHKAPANEVVRLATGFEFLINQSQQAVLNPAGINVFRFFEGRGYRLWGARLISSDPEWKYVNLRRYFAFLEQSIDIGTQWAVFANNNEILWANVRRTIEDFLYNEWRSGHLMGTKPEEAYFVRCDRSTMTQNDLDNGRLVCLIGVAAVRPAEFVIFRIGQWTADQTSTA